MTTTPETTKRPSLIFLLFLALIGSCLLGNPLKRGESAPTFEVEQVDNEANDETSTEEATELEAPAEETPAVTGVDLSNLGYKFDEAGARAIVATMGGPERIALSTINPSIVPSLQGRTEPVFVYRPMLEACLKTTGKPWRVHNQGNVGSCVGEGYALGCEIVNGVAWKLGKTDKWNYVATESVYGGSRVEAMGRRTAPGGDGSYGAAAFAWLTKSGGIVWRERFDELGYDLLHYDEGRCRHYGYWGNGGKDDNGRLDKIAKQSPIIGGAMVKTWDELAAAIANGYPVPVCSNHGFANTRDSQGFAAPRGQWAHCMCLAAIRFDRPGVLCMNSWGPNWISGPKWPEDQPDGSFWIDKQVVEAMLRGSGFPDTYALGDVAGFPTRRIDHGQGWGATTILETPIQEVKPTTSRKDAETKAAQELSTAL
jgi:hypothetical protein